MGNVRFRVPDSLLREAGMDPENASAFSRAMDLSWPTANNLLNTEIRGIEIETLTKLCDNLSRLAGRRVEPGEFFEYSRSNGRG